MTTCPFDTARHWKPHAVVYLAHVEDRMVQGGQKPDWRLLDGLLESGRSLNRICACLQDLLTQAARRGRLCRHCTAEDCLALHLNPRARAAFARALRRVLRIYARKE